MNDLFEKLTNYNPEKRISTNEYFNHPFFETKNIKIIFVGNQGCGKTSFIKKISNNIFEVNQTTIIDVAVKLILIIF